MVIEMTVAADGSIGANSVYRALVRNRAQLDVQRRGRVAGRQGPDAGEGRRVRGSAGAAPAAERGRRTCCAPRATVWARSLSTAPNCRPTVDNGKVTGIEGHRAKRRRALIEDFMIGANEVMAQTLRAAGVSSIRRVVKDPERWPRMVELAAQLRLPPAAGSRSRRAQRAPACAARRPTPITSPMSR